QATSSLGRLISTSMLPNSDSIERRLVLEASSSMSPRRGSTNRSATRASAARFFSRLSAMMTSQDLLLSAFGGPDSSVDSQRLDGYSAAKAIMVRVMGTPISAPGMPQSRPQKNTAKTTASGEIDSAAPAASGSR